MDLQLLMLRGGFSLSGGRYSGIYSLLGPMRSTQSLLHLTSRLVKEYFIIVLGYALLGYACDEESATEEM